MKAAKGIYRDVEKLYRLYALYNRSQEQLQQHVKIVDQNLAQNFGSGQLNREWVKFDFLMSGVKFEGSEVFKADIPETTFGYLLFCEGVKALLVSRNMEAKDLLQWETRIREFVESQDVGKNQESDLASMLWKNPHPSIRVYLYNSLLEVTSEGSDGSTDQGMGGALISDNTSMGVSSQTSGGIKGNVLWRDRDVDWDLPSGELVYHQMSEADDLKAEQVERLRAELADASVSDRARKILPFRSDEVDGLRQEMEMFDQNHVDFNLLARYFAVLKSSSKLDPKALAPILQAIAKVAVAIVDRFHGGLIVFYLKRLQMIEAGGVSADVVTKLRSYLKESVSKPENLLLLSSALNEASRVKIAKQLVEFLESKDRPILFTSLSDMNRENGIQAFLQVLIEKVPDLDQELLKWGEERIVRLIPHLQKLNWADSSKFFARCLRFRSPSILRAILPLLGELSMKFEEASSLFERLTDQEKHLFLEGLLSPRTLKDWAIFVRRYLQKDTWFQGSEDLTGLWTRVALRHLGGEAFQVIDPVIGARSFRFWPQYSTARSAILEVLLSHKESSLRSKIHELVDREKGLLFQNGELKQRLKDYR